MNIYVCVSFMHFGATMSTRARRRRAYDRSSRHKKTCLLVPQEDRSSCDTRGHVFLCHRLLVPQEDMSSCVTRGHVFLRHKKT